MRRLRVFGLCVVAVFVVSAVVVASAAAVAPEYGRCEKVAKNAKKEYGGKFGKSSCTVELPESERAKKGKYEWYPGVVKKVQTSSGGKGALEQVNGNGVGCAKGA